MNENPLIEKLSTFATEATYIEKPDEENYTLGVKPLDTLPAAWWNWFINKFTELHGKEALNINALYEEAINVLKAAGMQVDPVKDTQLVEAIQTLITNAVNMLDEELTKYVDDTKAALDSYIETTNNRLDEHFSNTTDVHGATTEPLPDTIARRTPAGTLKATDAIEDTDLITLKQNKETQAALEEKIEDVQGTIEALTDHVLYQSQVGWVTAKDEPQGTIKEGELWHEGSLSDPFPWKYKKYVDGQWTDVQGEWLIPEGTPFTVATVSTDPLIWEPQELYSPATEDTTTLLYSYSFVAQAAMSGYPAIYVKTDAGFVKLVYDLGGIDRTASLEIGDFWCSAVAAVTPSPAVSLVALTSDQVPRDTRSYIIAGPPEVADIDWTTAEVYLSPTLSSTNETETLEELPEGAIKLDYHADTGMRPFAKEVVEYTAQNWDIWTVQDTIDERYYWYIDQWKRVMIGGAGGGGGLLGWKDVIIEITDPTKEWTFLGLKKVADFNPTEIFDFNATISSSFNEGSSCLTHVSIVQGPPLEGATIGPQKTGITMTFDQTPSPNLGAYNIADTYKNWVTPCTLTLGEDRWIALRVAQKITRLHILYATLPRPRYTLAYTELTGTITNVTCGWNTAYEKGLNVIPLLGVREPKKAEQVHHISWYSAVVYNLWRLFPDIPLDDQRTPITFHLNSLAWSSPPIDISTYWVPQAGRDAGTERALGANFSLGRGFDHITVQYRNFPNAYMLEATPGESRVVDTSDPDRVPDPPLYGDVTIESSPALRRAVHNRAQVQLAQFGATLVHVTYFPLWVCISIANLETSRTRTGTVYTWYSTPFVAKPEHLSAPVNIEYYFYDPTMNMAFLGKIENIQLDDRPRVGAVRTCRAGNEWLSSSIWDAHNQGNWLVLLDPEADVRDESGTLEIQRTFTFPKGQIDFPDNRLPQLQCVIAKREATSKDKPHKTGWYNIYWNNQKLETIFLANDTYFAIGADYPLTLKQSGTDNVLKTWTGSGTLEDDGLGPLKLTPIKYIRMPVKVLDGRPYESTLGDRHKLYWESVQWNVPRTHYQSVPTDSCRAIWAHDLNGSSSSDAITYLESCMFCFEALLESTQNNDTELLYQIRYRYGQIPRQFQQNTFTIPLGRGTQDNATVLADHAWGSDLRDLNALPITLKLAWRRIANQSAFTDSFTQPIMFRNQEKSWTVPRDLARISFTVSATQALSLEKNLPNTLYDRLTISTIRGTSPTFDRTIKKGQSISVRKQSILSRFEYKVSIDGTAIWTIGGQLDDPKYATLEVHEVRFVPGISSIPTAENVVLELHGDPPAGVRGNDLVLPPNIPSQMQYKQLLNAPRITSAHVNHYKSATGITLSTATIDKCDADNPVFQEAGP